MSEHSQQVYDLSKHTTMQNVVPVDDFKDIIAQATEHIIDRLKNHCGPYGEYAMLVDTHAKFSNPKFTKDGHNIINSINNINPIMAWVYREISHIGKLVEREVGDGTTTAMIQAATMINIMMKSEVLTKLSITELNSVYAKFLEEFKQINAKLSISIDDYAEHFSISRTDAIKAIVRLQAMSSTHQDVELTDAIVELFTGTPESAWKYLSIRREAYETDHRIKCETSTCQYDIEVRPISSSMNSNNFNLVYEKEESTLFVARDPVVVKQALFEAMVKDITTTRDDHFRPVTVILSSEPDARTLTAWIELMDKPSNAGLGVFVHTPYKQSSINDLFGLQAVVNCKLYDNSETSVAITDLDILYKDGKLHIDGLYENPDNSMEHPALQQPNNIIHVILEQLDDMIEKTALEDSTPANVRTLSSMRRTYNRIRYTRYCQLVVGGKLHDNVTTIDVVEDAVKAVLHTLESGLVLGLNITTWAALHAIGERSEGAINHVTTAAINGLIVVRDSIFSKVPTSEFHIDINEISDPWQLEPFFQTAVMIDDGVRALPIDEALDTSTHPYAVVQPATLAVVIFERIGEVLLKLLKTNCVIVQGGLVPTSD